MTQSGTQEEWDLHDAVLQRLSVDWSAGTLEVELLLRGGGPASIVAEGVIMFRCPKREPWGRSIHINDARGPGPIYAEAHILSLELEMQSGDLIEVEAKSITLDSKA